MKIRPLTAVAVALGALGLAQAGRVAFDASNAFAAGEPVKAEAKADTKMGAGDGVGPPMCLPVDLAKEAGISAAEFRLLQSLQERRQTLDSRERDIVTRENVLKAADGRVQERMTALTGVEDNIKKLLGQVDELEAARIASLVSVYEKMKAKDAARIMEGLDEEVLIKIAQRMKTQPMALILANMSGPRARSLTQRLAAIDSPDLSPMANTPVPSAPASAAPATPPRPAPANAPKANAPAAGAGAPKAAPNGQQAAAAPAAGPAGAGPTAPKAPEAKAPNAPTTPQPAARPASGQAPADPAARGRANANPAAPAKG
jgi:flagellar motility protein MotE (MotC chaperone)